MDLSPAAGAGPAYGPFTVRNDEGGFYDVKIPPSEALAVSDNSAFARALALEGHGRPAEDRRGRAPLRHHDDDLAQSLDGDRRRATSASPARHGACLRDDRPGGRQTTGTLPPYSASRRPTAGLRGWPRTRRLRPSARDRSASRPMTDPRTAREVIEVQLPFRDPVPRPQLHQRPD